MSIGKIKSLSVTTTTAWTVYATIIRVTDGYQLNANTGFFEPGPSAYGLNLPEVSTVYSIDESRSIWIDGLYSILYFRQLGSSPAIASDTLVLNNLVNVISDVINPVNNSSPTFTGTMKAVNETLTGLLTTKASATGGAGLNVPHGTAPTSPVNGDVWSTTAGLFIRINGVTKSITFDA